MSNARWDAAAADGAQIVTATKATPRPGSPTKNNSKPLPHSGEINVADEVIDGLWIGNIQAGKMAATGLGDFDAIVNLTGDSTAWQPKQDHNKTYVNFHFGDGDLPDLDHLDALVEFIASLFRFQTQGRTRKVLIHCTMGVNRSGLVTALVVRRIKGLSGLEALRLVREKRDLHGNVFFSPGTRESGSVACFNSKFANYVESLA